MTNDEFAIRALKKAFGFYNRKLFDRLLPVCTIRFSNQAQRLGYDFPHNECESIVQDLITFHSSIANEPPLTQHIELVHEMVHCWQTHYGCPPVPIGYTWNLYHNKEWAQMAHTLGLKSECLDGYNKGNSVGNKIRLTPIEDGRFFKAFDKYTRTRCEIMLPSISSQRSEFKVTVPSSKPSA